MKKLPTTPTPCVNLTFSEHPVRELFLFTYLHRAREVFNEKGDLFLANWIIFGVNGIEVIGKKEANGIK